jgi:hypothetical protein
MFRSGALHHGFVIPTMLIVGLNVGRLWAIPVGALAWAGLVLASSATGVTDVVLAGALGAANVAVGVLVRGAVGRIVRRPRPMCAD